MCRLTARTSDNQCALHGGGHVVGDRPISLGAQQEPAPASASATVTVTSPGLRQNKPVERKQQLHRQPEQQQLRAQSVKLKRALPTWPLAKQILASRICFGDAEDISSAHLAGRLISLAPPEDRNNIVANENSNNNNNNIVHGRARQLTGQSSDNRAPLPRQRARCQPAPFISAADELGSAAAPSNYNHKRPFGEPFERPLAGWLQNATATPPFKATASRVRPSKGKCT